MTLPTPRLASGRDWSSVASVPPNQILSERGARFMDDDIDLRDFRNVARLFPLPAVVQFPHSVLPLHIFEPRYQKMTEDALATDKLITIVQLRPRIEPNSLLPHGFESVGCLGRIIQHERLPDGRFNMLLHGRKRVRLVEELPTDKLYRLAKAEIIEDLDEPTEDPIHEVLIHLFRLFLKRNVGSVDPDMDEILSAELPLGVLTDILAHALPFPTARKQMLLDDAIVARRAREISRLLSHLIEQGTTGPERGEPFPPPFSAN